MNRFGVSITLAKPIPGSTEISVWLNNWVYIREPSENHHTPTVLSMCRFPNCPGHQHLGQCEGKKSIEDNSADFVYKQKLELAYFTSICILFGEKLAVCFNLTAREAGMCFLTLYSRLEGRFWWIAVVSTFFRNLIHILSFSLSPTLSSWAYLFKSSNFMVMSTNSQSQYLLCLFRHRPYMWLSGTGIK